MTPLTILVISFIFLLLIGMPVFMSLAVCATIALLFSDVLPLAVVHTSMFEGLNIFPLLAIPCFFVAGALMERGNITHQIVDVVKLIVGRLYGGLGLTTVLACTLFAAVTGSGASTVAAVGSIMIPAMIRNGYGGVFAGSTAATGGTLGILIPPSNPMILYAIIGNLSVTGMFTAGILPGLLMSFGICTVVYFMARRKGYRADESAPPFSWPLFFKVFGRGFFSLATVVIVLGSIYAGLATPVEASVVAVLWALFVGGVVNRALSLKDIRDSLFEGAQLCGSLIIIMGAATLFAKIMTYEEAPLRLARAVLEFSTNKYVVLLLIIAALFVLGTFMETLVTVILVTPVLLPVIGKLGIDPIHFGVILIMCNEVGLLTPPLGVNLFVASKLANVSVERLAVAVLPLIAVMTVVIFIIMFFPSIATWLPYKLGYGI